MAYELAKKYVYKWSEINLAKLSLMDAFEVDGDRHIVNVYAFKLMPWCY